MREIEDKTRDIKNAIYEGVRRLKAKKKIGNERDRKRTANARKVVLI